MKSKKAICVIPARYVSTRFPGKPLADIAGKPMIERVYERAAKAKLIDEVVVATDDERIFSVVEGFGGKVVMTCANHPSGTDRLAEVAQMYEDADIILNVQGDEPLIEPKLIDMLTEELLKDDNLSMATAKVLLKEKEFSDPAAVKVVTDKNCYALYFSRSLLPYPRNQLENLTLYKHIGIYAYKRDFLLKFAKMEQSYLEQIEGLEQLRALENGYKIKVIETDFLCIGVDTPADLEEVNHLLKNIQ